MNQLIRYGFWLLAKVVLSLRYRVHVQGSEPLRGLNAPILVLPNHPGYVEPVIVLTLLWPTLRVRPLLGEGIFLNPILYPIMKLTRAVRLPDMDRASARARQQTEQAIAEVISGLKGGQNFILWPSGRAARSGIERVGSARATAEVLRAVPTAKVVLVRTRGIWGSSLSYAYTGTAPPLVRRLVQSVGLLLANLLVFMPRRQVNITIECLDRNRLPELRREILNPWLDEWYNSGGAEKPTFVPYHFLFGPRTREFPAVAAAVEPDSGEFKCETKQAVAEIVAHKLGRSLTEKELQGQADLDVLGLDSLDRVEVLRAVEKHFGFTSARVPENLGQLWAVAEGLVEHELPKPASAVWFRPRSSARPAEALGNTITEAFVNRSLVQHSDVTAADDTSGAVTYGRLLVGVCVLARRFAGLQGKNVGLLLPASVAADTAYMALLMAGKLPVILNWTTGPNNLAHAVRLMPLSHVVTSRKFIDRVGIEIAGVQYLYLEDLHKAAGKMELLWTLLQVCYLPGRVRRRVPTVDPKQPAMIIFTSGSERAPKAVPLTHGNILSELCAAVPFVGLTQRESMLGFLPPFHSFGIAAGILLPLLGGLRVVHHPDPTDAAGLLHKIVTYRPTMLIGTPTFVGYIIDRAKPGELDSLRLILVGAERCPESLHERCRKLAPAGLLLEGYGITECSPVVSINRPAANRPGTVGQPLPGLDICTVDVETEDDLPRGQRGVLWVSGPTVFPGYLGHDAPSPFRERHGRRWYVTGDLAEIDADGYIHLAGRLQRFLKAGGEMISLPAMEDPFARRYPPKEEGPRVAIEGVEADSGRRIVLFTTESVSLAEANSLLQQEGFHGVMRLDEVRHVERLPQLGTGKIDYKELRAQLATHSSTTKSPGKTTES
jgi:long-chain-fatty-acid--[acyl-carrier-protein] ligase